MEPRTPPGPRGHPLFGSALDLKRNILEALMSGWRQCGDVVRFKSVFPVYFLAHPDHVKHVLQDRHLIYGLPPFVVKKLRNVVGEALLPSRGESWRRIRRLAQPAFHRQRIEAMGRFITDATSEMLDQWRGLAARSQPLEIRSEMAGLTLRILTRTLFGTGSSRELAAVVPAMTVVDDHMGRRMVALVDLPWLPLPSNLRFKRALATFDTFVYGLIAERRRSGQDTGDLLSMLLQARDEETGGGLTDREVRDQLMGFVIAGHEPVAAALSWTWYLLWRHPEVAGRLRAELAGVLGQRTPTAADLTSLPSTSMVIQEALRLYPPFFMVPRSPMEDDEIGGYRIPAGAFVLMSPYVTHRHPGFWNDAEDFDPNRFAPTRIAERPRYAYFPFGGGPKQCIGEGFAMMEMQLILATVAQRYRLNLVPGHPVVPQPRIVLRPRDDVRMTLEPQAGGS